MKIVIMVKWTCSMKACSGPCKFELRWVTCKLFVLISIPPFDKNSLEEIHSHKNQNWNLTQEWFEQVTMSACPQAENKSISRLKVELKINLYKHPPPATCHMFPCSHACQSIAEVTNINRAHGALYAPTTMGFSISLHSSKPCHKSLQNRERLGPSILWIC